MGICSRRHFLLTICSLQLLTTIERQVFDFLGFMWAPILVNFFNIIFVILGFFGAFQYRPKYIITYCVWNTLWLGWNIFAICFYLDVGILDKNSDILNFGTGSFSWWQTNGPGCKIVNEITEPEIYRPSRPTNVTDCVLSYEVIEVMHASTQCILGLMAIIGGICLSRVFLEEDDSLQAKKRKKQQQRPLYSIEYTQPEVTLQDDSSVSPKPMTPRRVKRRSVISRDGTRRSSRRGSLRHSRRKAPVNVNRMTEQQQQQQPQPHQPKQQQQQQQENLYANTMPSVLTCQNITSLSQTALNYDRIAVNTWDRDRNVNWQPENVNITNSSPSLWNSDPNYSNTANLRNTNDTTQWMTAVNNVSTRNLTDNWQNNGELSTMQWQGHCNPTFQETSTLSLNDDDIDDDIYGTRPASARSSYSNYHGVRATPQVPTRQDVVRQSQKQFVLSGPPAYQDTVI